MQTYGMKSKKMARYVNVLKLLSHPIRFSIALLLKNNGVMNVSKIQQDLELTQSTVSQHISKLREAKIVSADRDGTKIYYSLSSDTAKLVLETYENS
ncbi:ArsR/SmtB family transcription factor [Facklamia sp. P12945]|uniref:ArsR/SmtB family transcription factor n=1 Tax=unclassified Facklamia TaxID=2622293 RepID=UPI003D1734CC